jgi:hypothetical protein
MQFIQHLGAAGVSLALMGLALPAQAHICMEAPVSRVGPSCTSASAQKPGPCGINTRSTKYVTECRPGQTLTVTLNETINHDSHYRIAFNPSGATFEDPTGIDDKDGKHPFVLLDGIKDESAARQSVKVTLPSAPCDQCTLQLIQVMYDKTGNGFGTDDIYYACADIVLKGAPATGECGAAGGDAGAPTDPGIVAPKPVNDAGSGAPLPPVQTTDAGSSTDAGSTNGSADGSAPSGGGQADASAGSSVDSGDAEGEDEAEDRGGCAISAPRRERDLSAIVTLLTVATLLHRRRRRG